MNVGDTDGDTIQCLTNHLSTFAMVLINPEVNVSVTITRVRVKRTQMSNA